MKTIINSTIEQLENFLAGSRPAVAFAIISDKDACYCWIQHRFEKIRSKASKIGERRIPEYIRTITYLRALLNGLLGKSGVDIIC